VELPANRAARAVLPDDVVKCLDTNRGGRSMVKPGHHEIIIKKQCQVSSFDRKLRFGDRAWHGLCLRFGLSDDFADLTGGSIMKFSRTFAVLAVGFALLLASDAGALSITYELDVHFGEVDSDGTVSITFDDSVGVDDVLITLDASNLATDEKVGQWNFNYSGDGGSTFTAFTDLTASDLGGTGAGSLTNGLDDIDLYNAQSENADGDGLYNIELLFDTSDPDTFSGGEVITFVLSGTGLTADDFALIAAVGGGNGPFYSAAHIQSTGGDNEGSDWLGAVPEPGPMVLFATSLIVAGALSRRPRKS
jgi:hypothetical protein